MPPLQHVDDNDQYVRNDDYGSGAYEETAALFDQDAELLVTNLGYED